MLFGCCAGAARYDEVAAADYSYIELSGAEMMSMSPEERSAVRERVRQGPIPCIGFNSYCRGTPAIVGPEYSTLAAREYARRVCALGGEMGIKYIGIGSPAARRLPEGYDMESAKRQCGEFLLVTAQEAAKYGITVLLEALNDRVCNYVNRTAEALELVRELGISNLGLVLDFYHMAVMGENVLELTEFLPYVRHVHISSCGTSLERGYPQAEETAYYRNIISALKKGGYGGDISVEAADRYMKDAAGTIEMLRMAERVANF